MLYSFPRMTDELTATMLGRRFGPEMRVFLRCVAVGLAELIGALLN
jgi:hypothetical protein